MNHDKIILTLKRWGLTSVFFFCGLIVYFSQITFNDLFRSEWFVIIKVIIIVGLLVPSLYLFRIKLFYPYGTVIFAFFSAAISIFLGLYFGKFISQSFFLDQSSIQGFTLNKLLEDIMIVLIILVLIHLAGENRKSLYLTRGNLKYGLIIGFSTFLILTLLAVIQSNLSNISMNNLIRLSPSILIIVFADGFMEELLFRGLFLKRFSAIIGNRLSNILTAVLFALAHIQITYFSEIIIFLLVLFSLGLLWGYIIQRTNSLLASVLFHAGADTLIIIPALHAYGVTI